MSWTSGLAGTSARQSRISTGSPGRITASSVGVSGMRLTPNQTLLSQLRWRARAKRGSWPFAAVSGSTVVSTQRSQPLTFLKVTGPMRSRRQPSSAQAGAPDTTTLGRNRRMGTGPSAALGPSAIQPFSASRDSSLVSNSGYPSANDTRSLPRLYLGLVGRRVGSSRYTRRTGSPTIPVSQADAASSAWVASRSLSHTLTGTRSVPDGTGTVTSGSHGLARVSLPLSTRGVTRTRAGYSRAVTGSPTTSTIIHRRSPASPHGWTTASASRSPRHDLTG